MTAMVAWIGLTDIRASMGDQNAGDGPIAQAVTARSFDEVILLTDLENSVTARYAKWLRSKTLTPFRVIRRELSGPTNFGEIYSSVIETLQDLTEQQRNALTYHISPGTPAMAAVWIILAKTHFPAELIESSQKHGVRTVDVPFEISAEFLPRLFQHAENALERTSEEFLASASTFEDIVHQSPQMKNVVDLARRLALFEAPVLIEGESGTGKELFAKAIHKGGPRANMPFVAVNCGAIPTELIESELFGHEKGAFTGATRQQSGKFTQANGGTIFLDEIGELPLQAQVKLLRVVQEKELSPIGADKSIPIDVRIISATNRRLIDEVAKEGFREDLFYRLAVFILKVPPLRSRQGDLSLLIKHFINDLNRQNVGKFWNGEKSISPAGRNRLLAHSWPGNIRELQATLMRAALFSKGQSIKEADVSESIFQTAASESPLPSYPKISPDFNIQNFLRDATRHYLKEALDLSHGNKSAAARMLGLPNYQTFLNWWKKHLN